ncbi:subclass B3 metallo-beta-lactamase [Novosphingobium sp. SG720]|uniref:subclass B3 metallo-beta-lactamase n=1 Tax=Novosphingobium sp. SG720 TaxID=2586998 RepID=UPI001445EF37|nr:subclass B3 metallo-beta-lactamase [Novosphingobium sp. SG720]NKJ41776.1 metallo-beta-lactamase class B [Novosphingobium sp. SG720]
MRAKLPFAAALAGLVLSPLPAPAKPALGQPALGQPAPAKAPGAVLASACAGRDGWADPAPPQRIFANTWYVGTCGISAVLITSPQGHVLVDAGVADAAQSVAHNIEAAGFRLADVRWIVLSHEHSDHAGGLAALKRMTGARLAALPAAARVLETGKVPTEDPQAAWLKPFPGVHVDRVLRDGDVLATGALRLVAHATPGHAPGSTSWTWTSCAGRDCRAIAYVDSVTALAAPGWRFADHPAYVAAFRASLARIARLPCTLLITPHPGASDLFDRLAAGAPRPAPGACRAYAARGRAKLDETLAKEAASPQRPTP